MKQKRVISVWSCGPYSGPTPWLVTLDDFEDGRNVATETLSAHRERSEALTVGAREATLRSIPFEVDNT